VQQGGVVGLGGAAFPTHVKLAPPRDITVDTIILNGAECEPYLTTDHRIMVEYPERVQLGARIMLRTLGARRVVIGVERNKPDAIEALERTVGSAASIAEIFETGLPLLERIVTVSGPGVREPSNLIVPVGTKLRDLLAACGGVTDDAEEIIFGGPMMGVAQSSLDVPIVKGTTGVIVLATPDINPASSFPCIRCGRCLDACPVFLNPSALADYARKSRYEEMEQMHVMDCMLCGSCSYVCPSKIPLAQLFQASKTQIRKRKQAVAI
jgi:electron transport complex protein RnfC